MAGLVSVVIPAHNEALLIKATLRRLLDTDPQHRLEIVVVANGCTDATAEVATGTSPRVRVVEIAKASKVAALNAGDAAAVAFPRVYLDADVDVTGEALLAVADALLGPPYVGAPVMKVDTTRASRLVRWQYRVWELTDYRSVAMVGSGVYVLSAGGRARFDAFPEIIADDLFVMRQFAAAERITIPDRVFTVASPRTLVAFISRQSRIVAGNEQIRVLFPALAAESGAPSMRILARRLARRPALWLPAVPYVISRVLARRRAARVYGNWAAQNWNRDATTRTEAAVDSTLSER